MNEKTPAETVIKEINNNNIAANVRQFLLSSMDGWKTELASCRQRLGEVDINMGILQGDSLSPLLLMLCMAPLSFVLRGVKCKLRSVRRSISERSWIERPRK